MRRREATRVARQRMGWGGGGVRLQSDSPGRQIHCPIFPTEDLGSSRGEAPDPRMSFATNRGRRASGPKGSPGLLAPGSRQGLPSPRRLSLPNPFLETPEAASSKERRESTPGAARVRGGGAQGHLKSGAAGRRPVPVHNPYPSACSGGDPSPGMPASRSQPGEQRVWEARSGSENGGGGRQEGRWGQGRVPACTSSPGRMMERSTLQAPH